MWWIFHNSELNTISEKYGIQCIQCCYHTVKLYVICSKNMLNIYNCYDSSVIVSYTVHHWRTLRTKWLALYLFWDFLHLSMSICLFIVVTLISSYLMTVQVFLFVWYDVLLTADSWCILLYYLIYRSCWFRNWHIA